MSISVKVAVESREKPYSLQVNGPQKIKEVVEAVRKLSDGRTKDKRMGESEQALYWPAKKVWIESSKTVWDSGIEESAQLELKSLKKPIDIRFMDGSMKTVTMDISKPVKDVVMALCEELNLACWEELSLVVTGDYLADGKNPSSPQSEPNGTLSSVKSKSFLNSLKRGVNLEVPSSPSPAMSPSQRRRNLVALNGSNSPASPAKSPSIFRRKITAKSPSVLSPGAGSPFTFKKNRLKKQISKKHQLRLDTPWLDPEKSLVEQDVTDQDELLVKFRYHYNMEVSKRSEELRFLFMQAKTAFLNGELPCEQEDLCKFAAMLTHVQVGQWNENPSVDLNEIKQYILPKKVKLKVISPCILSEYKELNDLDEIDVKICFIRLWSAMRTFGIEFLSCAEFETKRKGLIGVSKNQIVLIDHDRKKPTSTWPFESLLSWNHKPEKDLVYMRFPEKQELRLYVPDYSDVLSDCISGHQRLRSKYTKEGIDIENNRFLILSEPGSPMDAFSDQLSETDGARKSKCLTFDDVFWAADVANPLVSAEEMEEMRRGSWENPAFAKIDDVVEERFAFLDQALEADLDS